MRFNLFLLVIALLPLCAYAQTIHPDKSGDALAAAVIVDYKPTTVLTYGEARDTMYRNIYRDDQGEVSCYYTGSSLFLPLNVDPSAYLYRNGDDDGITCEHIYPQSKGASEENGNAHSDLHALAPVIWRANEARSNYPFGEVPDDETDHWYLGDQDLRDEPIHDKEAYSELLNGGWGNPGLFEPAENIKGEIARAVFYFQTMYEVEAMNADPDFFESMKTILLEWHHNDPVEQQELLWSQAKAKYQNGKANPFVLDCSLASRIYGDEAVICQEPTSIAESGRKLKLSIYPNPVVDILYVSIEEVPSKFEILDLAGEVVLTSGLYNDNRIPVGSLDPGSYFLRADFASGHSEVLRFVKL